jgi:DNA-binding NtrC family response regulator
MINNNIIKVLQIEDNPGDITLVRKSLPKDKFLIMTAKNLSEGLKLIKQNKFDVFVVDLNLPDSKGIDSIDRIASLAPGYPIIVLTSIEEEYIQLESANHGAFFFFQKSELPCKVFNRAIKFANIYYGSEHERAARGSSIALRNLKNFMTKSSTFGRKK